MYQFGLLRQQQIVTKIDSPESAFLHVAGDPTVFGASPEFPAASTISKSGFLTINLSRSVSYPP